MNAGDVIAGKYVLERKLGRGGMGEVWLARHRLMDESFAVKFLFPHLLSGDAGDEIVQKFIREAKIGVRVDHANVVKVRDVDAYGGTYFIVMDYIPGADLKTLIKDRPLTENQIVLIATQVLEALGAAHSRGFIHRDVKPSNILVTRAGKVYLTDFGIAKALDTVAFASSTPIFTAEYAAPEQIEPERFGPVTAATDLYSLGVTMYHMATGRPPFTGTTMQVLRQHTDAVAPPAATLNTQLSPNMTAVIAKALAKYPRERFPDAQEMAAGLRGTTPPPAPPVGDDILKPLDRKMAELKPIERAAPAVGTSPPEKITTGPGKGLATASLVISCVGLVCWGLGLLGAILGAVALKKIETGTSGEGRQAAKAGIIIGIISVGLCILYMVWFALAGVLPLH
jgi:serine/threonine-protein kinase